MFRPAPHPFLPMNQRKPDAPQPTPYALSGQAQLRVWVDNKGMVSKAWLKMPMIKTPRAGATPGRRCCSLFRMWRTANLPALKPATPCMAWLAAAAWAWAGEEAAEGLAVEARRREDQAVRH